MKIVLNKQPGGLYLNRDTVRRYLELTGKKYYFYRLVMGLLSIEQKIKHRVKCSYEVVDRYEALYEITTKDFGPIIKGPIPEEFLVRPMLLDRSDPILIQAIEELGDAATKDIFISLVIEEIPDGVSWEIKDCGEQGELLVLK